MAAFSTGAAGEVRTCCIQECLLHSLLYVSSLGSPGSVSVQRRYRCCMDCPQMLVAVIRVRQPDWCVPPPLLHAGAAAVVGQAEIMAVLKQGARGWC